MHRCLLSEDLNEGIEHFISQFTGGLEPKRLADLDDYYTWLSGENKPTKLWFARDRTNKYFNGTCPSWVGCSTDNFSLGANGFLGSIVASGVRFPTTKH